MNRLPRKLAEILHADVAGYSRLSGVDEEGTHRRLRESLDLFTHCIRNHGGRVVNYAGDAVLADFPTVTDALTCAVAVQRAVHRSSIDPTGHYSARRAEGCQLLAPRGLGPLH